VAKLDQELVTMHRREEQLTMALQPITRLRRIVLDLSPNLGQLCDHRAQRRRLADRADRRQ